MGLTRKEPRAKLKPRNALRLRPEVIGTTISVGVEGWPELSKPQTPAVGAV